MTGSGAFPGVHTELPPQAPNAAVLLRPRSFDCSTGDVDLWHTVDTISHDDLDFAKSIGSPHWHPRRGAVLLALGWLPFLLVRLEGFSGSYLPELVWRLENYGRRKAGGHPPRSGRSASDTATPPPALESSPQDWPGFRGLNRDSRVVVRQDQRGVDSKAAQAALENRGWSGLVELRGCRRFVIHSGTIRRGRGCRLLQRHDRPRTLAARRCRTL